jgi:hypothetical protein
MLWLKSESWHAQRGNSTVGKICMFPADARENDLDFQNSYGPGRGVCQTERIEGVKRDWP